MCIYSFIFFNYITKHGEKIIRKEMTHNFFIYNYEFPLFLILMLIGYCYYYYYYY
jgi:hypothetical protein